MTSVLTIFCPVCGTRTASPSRAISDDAVICTCGACGVPFTLLATAETVARVAALNGLTVPASGPEEVAADEN